MWRDLLWVTMLKNHDFVSQFCRRIWTIRAHYQQAYLDPPMWECVCVCVCVCLVGHVWACKCLASVLQNCCEPALRWRLLASLKLHRSVSTVEVTKEKVSPYTHTLLCVAAIHTRTVSFSLCLARTPHLKIFCKMPSVLQNKHTHTHQHTHISTRTRTHTHACAHTHTHIHTLFPTIRALVLNN